MKQLKILVGLGNPGPKYTTTRHNVGWLALDLLGEQYGFTQFLYQKKFTAEVANGEIDGWQVIAVKPHTYMNRSGMSVQGVLDFYKPDVTDLLVVQDDINITPCKMKLKFNGSAAGHNGIKDIVAKIGTDKFWRLKLGVGRPPHPDFAVSDYVLGELPQDEVTTRQQQDKELAEKLHERLKNTG